MSSNKKLKCLLCPCVFAKPSDLDTHLMSHKKEKPHQCPHCKFSCSYKSVLTFHIRRLHSTPTELEALKKHKCEFCNYSSLRKIDLVNHLRRHTGDKPFPCTEEGCGRTFTHKSSFKLHIKVHRDERPFKCKFPGCEYRGRVILDVKRHWAVHGNERPFKCPVPECNYSAKVKCHLRQHERSIHRPPQYACSYPGCDYKGRQRIHVRMHENTHWDTRPFKCPFPGCSYSAKMVQTLCTHKKTHTGTRNPHRCTFPGCNRAFPNPYHLKEHERIHNGEEPYKCDFPGCQHTTWVKSSLTQHRKMHGREKHPCSVSDCTYVGKTESHLKRHAESHKDPAYVSCPVAGCNYRSACAKSLDKHKMVHESEGKRYSCPLCPRHYKWQCVFENHLRTHNAEKPFKCPDCQSRFGQIYWYVSHAKKFHGKELSSRDFPDHRIEESGNNVKCLHWWCSLNIDGVCDPMMHLLTEGNSAAESLVLQETGIKGPNGNGESRDPTQPQIQLQDCFVPLVRVKIVDYQ